MKQTYTEVLSGKVKVLNHEKHCNNVFYGMYTGLKNIPLSPMLDSLLMERVSIRISCNGKELFNKTGMLLKEKLSHKKNNKGWVYAIIEGSNFPTIHDIIHDFPMMHKPCQIHEFDSILWDLSCTENKIKFEIAHLETEEIMSRMSMKKLEYYGCEEDFVDDELDLLEFMSA